MTGDLYETQCLVEGAVGKLDSNILFVNNRNGNY